jgi:hypothetical protein
MFFWPLYSTKGGDMKICYKCKVSKPLDQFHKKESSNDGKQSMCRECANGYAAERGGKVRRATKVRVTLEDRLDTGTPEPSCNYMDDGIKRLACAVLREANEDATGRRWSEKKGKFKGKKVKAGHKASAILFLKGQTEGPGKFKDCFEFVCGLAGVEESLVRKGSGL